MIISALDNLNDFRATIFEMIDQAECSDQLILNYFILRQDQNGMALLQRLKLASLRGVKIQLIVDGYGSLLPAAYGSEFSSAPLSQSYLQDLMRSGVSLYIFNPVDSTHLLHPKNLKNWNRYVRRNHNKLFVFELKKQKLSGIITGDTQWADDNFGIDYVGNNVLVLDQHIYQEARNYCWKLMASSHCQKINPHVSTEEIKVENLLTYKISRTLTEFKVNHLKFFHNSIDYGAHRFSLQDIEMRLMENAKYRVFYCTPYFCPDKDLRNSFIKSKQNKIDLKILIGKYKEHPFLSVGTKIGSLPLLRKKISIFEFSGEGNFHYKDLIVDQLTFVKSSNGEGRSRNYNQEAGILIDSPQYTDYRLHKINQHIKKSMALCPRHPFLSRQPISTRVMATMLMPLLYKHL
jgi:cardiolipin synthase